MELLNFNGDNNMISSISGNPSTRKSNNTNKISPREGLNDLLSKGKLSAGDLDNYLLITGTKRADIISSVKKMDFLVRSDLNAGYKEKFNELIYMISIGLSDGATDVTLIGGEVNVDLKKITAFLKEATNIRYPLDNSYNELALKLCFACKHTNESEQGKFLTSTAQGILDHNKISGLSMSDLKLKIANGYHGEYNIFEVIYKLTPQQKVCTNDFREGGKNTGDFPSYSKVIKNKNYWDELANNLRTKISKVSSSEKSLSKLDLGDRIDIKPKAVNIVGSTDQMMVSAYNTIAMFIVSLNVYLRKAYNSKVDGKYKQGNSTTNNAARVSQHKVSFTLSNIQEFFKNEIKIDITIQEAFILAALCTVKKESTEDLNNSSVMFIQALVPKDAWERVQGMNPEYRKGIIDQIKQDLSNGAIYNIHDKYFQVTDGSENNVPNEPSVVVENGQQLSVNHAHPDDEKKGGLPYGIRNRQNNVSFNNDDDKKEDDSENNSQELTILAQSKRSQQVTPPPPPPPSSAALKSHLTSVPPPPPPLGAGAGAKISEEESKQVPPPPAPPAPPAPRLIAGKERSGISSSLLAQIQNPNIKLRKVVVDTAASLKSSKGGSLDPKEIAQIIDRRRATSVDSSSDDDEWDS